MPTITDISINDAVPAAHVFKPVSITGPLASYKNRDGSIAAGDESLTIKYSEANGSRATDRVDVRLNLPIERTVDSVNTIDGVARLQVVAILPSSMTVAERAEFYALSKNLIASATVESYVSDLLPVY